MIFQNNILKKGVSGCLLLLAVFVFIPSEVSSQIVNDNNPLGISGNDGSFSSPSNVNSGRQETLVQCSNANDCDFKAFLETFERIVDLLLAIAVGFSTIIFAYAGFLYLTAGGNPGKRQQANNMITAAVVGFFIAAAAWLLVEVFINTLGGNSEVIRVKEFNFKK